MCIQTVYFTTVVLKPVLEYPQPCTFCMSPSSITPDSTHQLISGDCKTWSGCVRYRLPKASSRALTVPSGRGGGRSGGPSRQTRTGTQDGDLQSRTDNSEAMAELAALEAMAVQGAQEAMVELGALEAMAELGALEALAELGALEAMADGLRGPWPRSSRPGPYSWNSYTPPKISLGKLGGIRSPPGLNTQHDSTKHDRNALQGQTDRTRQDIPQEPEALLGWLGSWGFLWAWHDIRGPHRVPQQPLPQQGGRWLEWPPWPQQEEPPAPDESPWTRQGSLKCSCGHNKTDTRHSWPWRVDSIHRARDSGGRRAWVSGDPAGLSQRRSGGHWVRGDPAGIESEAGRWCDLLRTTRLGEQQPGN